MVTRSRASTTLSSTSPMKLRSNHSVTARQGLHYATYYPYVRPFLPPPIEHGSNANPSETLANLDAILFLPETCCLYEDPRGETVYLATELG